MPKIELQYLFINKSEQTSDECITILGDWFQEKITEGNTFTYTISGKEYIFRYSENIIGGACYLKLTYSCGRTSKLILSNLESLDIKIKEVSGRNGYSSITLVDSLSTSYSKQLSPLFTEYELELRKLVYLIIPPMMTKNWVDTFSEELIANVKKITKNGFKSEEILEHITLYDFEDYLFNKNYIDLKSNNAEVTPCKFNEISHEKLIEIIVGSEYDVSEPYSLWERYFSPRSTSRIEISKLKIDMSVIRDGRNIVAHQKKIRSKKFNELKTILKKYIAELKSISMSIIQKEVENEILEIASEDFETVIKKSLNEYLSELNLAEYTTPLNDFTQLPGYTAAKLSLSELSQLSSAMHKGIHSLTKNHVLESISQSQAYISELTKPLNSFTQLPGYTAAKLSLSELSQQSSAMHKGIHSLTKNHVLESISQSQAYISELTKPLNDFTQLPGYTATQINLAELPKISDLVLDPLNSVSPNLNLKKK